MNLKQEIEKASRQVSTDAFSLTVGEIVNMYRDNDVTINPDFQRFFRWDIERKSRLIESILVRIPLPPIFVFELSDSRWEVIDGLQRLSTILEFMGELKDPDSNGLLKPRALVGTEYLPSLRGAFWSGDLMEAQLEVDAQRSVSDPADYIDNSATYFSFDSDTQRAVKRTKIGIQLLEKKSDPKSKYDLFQRLNSGGMTANDQELRNCAIVMANASFFFRLREVAQSDYIRKLIPLGISSIRKSNDLDNLCKIIAFSFKDYRIGTDIEEFVTHAMIEIAGESDGQLESMILRLYEGMKLLVDSCGYNALRPYKDGEFVGRIGRTSIEIILVGILKCLSNIKGKPDPGAFVREKIITFWGSDESKRFSAAGIAGTDRVQYTIPLGIKIFFRMNPETNLSSRLQDDITWRIRELSELVRACREASGIRKDALLRASLPVIYAHWEGFFVFATNSYLNFVTDKRIKVSLLRDEFWALTVRRRYRPQQISGDIQFARFC